MYRQITIMLTIKNGEKLMFPVFNVDSSSFRDVVYAVYQLCYVVVMLGRCLDRFLIFLGI